jgi:YegS/Rv2252/BmrU family lipid kinase
LNPIAGKGNALKALPKINAALEAEGVSFELIQTKGPGDALNIAREHPLDDETVVVAAGGDGTCNEVANGLLLRQHDKPPLYGLLPIGRGNDFAYNSGVGEDLDKALEILVHAEPKPLDAGIVTGGYFPEGRYFVNGVGIGFDTKVGFEAAKYKIPSGFAYVVGAIICIVKYGRDPILQVDYTGADGESGSFRQNTALLSIMNGIRMGGVFRMAPNAKTDDGLLDFCTIRQLRSRRRLIWLVLQYTKGAQGGFEETTMGRALKYHITAPDGGIVAHCDGETVCTDGKELEMVCIPGALRIIKP